MVGGELEWDSKESSDNAFSNPSPEFLAWSEKYADVMTCDIEGRFLGHSTYLEILHHLER